MRRTLKRLAVFPLRVAVSIFVLLGFLGNWGANAQDAIRITEVSITSGNMVRLAVHAESTSAASLVMESADSAAGPWRKEPEFVRNITGDSLEFLTPHRAYFPHRFYRFSIFSNSSLAIQGLPYIRFIAPTNNIKPGQLVTLFGANFAKLPADNTVSFELLTRSWTADVMEAATNYIIARVPTNLVSNFSTAMVYRVSVKTGTGTGNGVGASVLNSFDNFDVSPRQIYIAQPPGPGKQIAVVGGGTPPYSVVPLSSNEQKYATVTMNGPIIEVTAATNVTFASIYPQIIDSSTNFVRGARLNVGILPTAYKPKMTAEFHTLLEGTEPGLNLTATLSESSNGSFQTEELVLELQNISLDFSHLQPGEVIGLLQLFDPGGPYYYAFQHMLLTEVTPTKAVFDVISLDDGGEAVLAHGAVITDPPTLVLDVKGLAPGSLVSQPLTLKLVFTDELFQLPGGEGAEFSIVGRFTSVSTSEEAYLPLQASATNRLVTTNVPAGAPRIERLVPAQGEIYRNVHVIGSGLPATPFASNAVTFAGPDGTRVAAEIVSSAAGELVVAVPPSAITGPVRVSAGDQVSNDFLFAVRFHPDAVLMLDNVAPNTPTSLRLLYEQPQDERETGDEMGPHSMLCRLIGGHINVLNLTNKQQVGTVILANSYTGRKSTNQLVYAGQEPTGARRHVFEEPISSYVLARLYYSEDERGVTLDVFGGDGIFQFNPGIAYDFQFTWPIFTPTGNEVAIRVEAVSKPFTSIPGNQLRVIWNSIQRSP